MSTQPIARINAGLPAGGQFAPTGHSEADGSLEPVAVCPKCGLDSDQEEGIPCDTCLDDTCPCGESLDDGEGYDGLCGNCADRAHAAELGGDGDDDEAQTCILTGEPGENPDDCTTHDHEPAAEEPERLHENMGDGPIVTAPSGKYGFYAPTRRSGDEDMVTKYGPVVQVAQLVDDGRAWGTTPARYHASSVSGLRPGQCLAIDMSGGWQLDPEDTAALAQYARETLAAADASKATTDATAPPAAAAAKPRKVTERDLEIGRTIYDQIPIMARGNMDAKFANAHAVPNGLRMTRCLAGRRRVDVTVVLNGRDLYDIDVVTTETLHTDI